MDCLAVVGAWRVDDHGYPILPKMHGAAYELGPWIRPSEPAGGQGSGLGPESSGPVWYPRRDLTAASLQLRSARGMLTFRTSITFAVMAFILALAALLIAIQDRALRWATQGAASAYMDATSTKAFGRLQSELTALASLVHVLATSSSVADSNERTETGPAIPLFKAVLQKFPQF